MLGSRSHPASLSLMRTISMILIILATALIVLIWPALVLRRSVQVEQVYSSDPALVHPVTARHITAFRKLRFAWNALIEGGGPVVDPWTPYGSENMADDI